MGYNLLGEKLQSLSGEIALLKHLRQVFTS